MAHMSREFSLVSLLVETVFERGKDTIQEACQCNGSGPRQTESCSLEESEREMGGTW